MQEVDEQFFDLMLGCDPEKRFFVTHKQEKLLTYE